MMKNAAAGAKKKKQIKCDEEVKELLQKYGHKKCTSANRRMYCRDVTGATLNQYLLKYCKTGTHPSHFVGRKKYHICYNLYNMIEQAKASSTLSPSLPNTAAAVPNRYPAITPTPVEKHQNRTRTPSREERLFLRNRIGIDDPKLTGVKKVNVNVKGDDVIEIDVGQKRANKKLKFTEDVLKNYNKVPFGKLTMRIRKDRIADVGKTILGACIDRTKFRDNADEYLHNNTALGVEVLNLLDGVKVYLESKLRIKFDSMKDVAMIPIENDTEGRINRLDDKNKMHQVAIALLGESTQSGYKRMRRKIKKSTGTKLPTYESLTKHRPEVVSVKYDEGVMGEDDEEAAVEGVDGNEDEDRYVDFFEMEGFPPEFQQIEEALRQISDDSSDGIVGAKIQGSYEDYMNIMKSKHEMKGRTMKNDDGAEDSAVVIDSIDGAEHLRSKKRITSVISFSSMMFTPKWIQEREVTAGSSLNILTWQQIRAKESWHTMIPAVEEYYRTKREFREKEKQYCLYDVHDGKMLYLLTQHSQWSRNNHPYLLCTCAKGQSIRNGSDHQCNVITHEEQLNLYERSKRRWNNKKRIDTDQYDVKKHSDWVDEKNKGVSHFGLHPDLLPRNTLRFDTFHMKCAVTRKLMGYLRSFILDQEHDVIKGFNKVMKKFWNNFHVYVWRSKKSFSSFQGNELALFVANVDVINNFLRETFEETPQLIDIMNSLQLWVSLFKFLGVTYIDDDDDAFLMMIDKFETNLVKFYDHGSRTFLSTNGMINGNGESFYCHALRFYMPSIIKMTFRKHHLGPGIFNMQGFERRNKESKNCLGTSCNHRGNILINNMNNLFDIFYFENKEQ